MQNLLTEVSETTWAEVFDAWRAREKGYWEAHVAERGYESWEVWRSKLLAPMHPESRSWKVYRINDPAEFIPQMWIGGFRGWRIYLPEGVRQIQFKDLVRSPEIKKNEKVMEVLQGFPKETTIIAAKCGEEVVLLEGMHRCSALAIAAAEGVSIDAIVHVALTEFSESERERFEQCRTQQATGTFLDDLREDKM